ncbi:hypothetical protein [Hamadaea tsunoensis]|uniref:hypothetical protein n=1 Tax=Hamadaea tsunoensis TaxID=53368 RepID=UPI0004177989|nr:hypothetical protein [Hamadaea tsunoensis]
MSEPAGHPAFAYPPAPQSRRPGPGRWLALGAVVLVLVCGGLTGGSLIARQQAAGEDRPAIPSVVISDRPGSASPVAAYALALPAKLINRSLSTDKSLRKLADQAAAERRAQSPNAEVIAGYYGSFVHKNLLFVLAVRTPTGEPAAVLAQIRAGMQTRQPGLVLATVAPGPLGGVASCGDSTSDGNAMAVCVWVDAGSYGFLQFFGATAKNVGDQFRTARGQLERRL